MQPPQVRCVAKTRRVSSLSSAKTSSTRGSGHIGVAGGAVSVDVTKEDFKTASYTRTTYELAVVSRNDVIHSALSTSEKKFSDLLIAASADRVSLQYIAAPCMDTVPIE